MSSVVGVMGDCPVVIQNANGSLTLSQISAIIDPLFSSLSTKTGSVSVTSGQKIVVCDTLGQVYWSPIVSASRYLLKSDDNQITLTLTNGNIIKMGTGSSIMMKTGNHFSLSAVRDMYQGMTVTSSLFLPVRNAVQTGSVFTVSIQMSMSSHDPQAQVPLRTNTWGDITVPYGLISVFQGSTRDIDDIATFTTALNEGVTYVPIESVLTWNSGIESYIYTFQTLEGNFMLSNGIFMTS